MRSALVLVVALGLGTPTGADVLQVTNPKARVRPMQPRVEALLSMGMARSATFRHLVRRIEASDVIVYIEARRDLREKVYKAFIARGDNGNENDNSAVIGEILKLREESARLLGYETFAAYRLEDSMAKTPQNVRELLERRGSGPPRRVKAASMRFHSAQFCGGLAKPASASKSWR